MSGFVTIFHRDGRPADPEALASMTRRIAHRGPDGQTMRHAESLGMAHLLLATGGASNRERMPAVSRDGALWLTGELRLDNRQELWRGFGFDGSYDPHAPDSRFVLAAYEKWGEECPVHLLGDFAFVIWDGRKRQIFAARDPFGVKPFYYHLSDKLFAAASEIKALLAMPEINRDLDEVYLLDYLAVLPLDADSTIYQGVRKLPQSHRLVATGQQSKISRYWEFDAGGKSDLGSDANYCEAFRALFFRAVERRLPNDCSVGSYLSGGFDSSSIAGVSKKLLHDRGVESLDTFSAIFPRSPESDEGGFIRMMVNEGGFTPHFYKPDDCGPLTNQAEITELIGEPRFGYNYYYILELLRMARAGGIRVMLDGFDGDTTLSHGEGLFAELAREGRWLKLFFEWNAYRRNLSFPMWSVYCGLIWRHGVRPRVPGTLLHFARLLPRRKGRQVDGNRHHMIRSEFKERNDYEGRKRRASQAEPVDQQRYHKERLESIILAYTLEQSDALSASCGIEPRYPFFDRELAEFCLSLPPRLKLENGFTRHLARKSLGDVLPRSICWRPGKSDLSYAFNETLRRVDHDLVANSLLVNAQRFDFLDSEAIGKLRTRFCEGACSNSEAMLLWRLSTLFMWREAEYSQQQGVSITLYA